MTLRSTVLALMLALSVPAGIAAQSAKPKQADPVFGVDKVKHFFIAGFVESMTFAGLEAARASRSPAKTGAIALTAAVSIGREVHDRRTKGLFSFRDLAWDFIGSAAAILVINKTR